ncbi:hypothetical protein EAI_13884 [Harpegnathos saltator]|uniref:Uncharacterized protein n=1 Tax=Harpegnathos saltator TaxID=610380 RepID=E2BKF5_HARSA|nr:hypothetical protein EAI_13884 [Harpegnathos saltator]
MKVTPSYLKVTPKVTLIFKVTIDAYVLDGNTENDTLNEGNVQLFQGNRNNTNLDGKLSTDTQVDDADESKAGVQEQFLPANSGLGTVSLDEESEEGANVRKKSERIDLRNRFPEESIEFTHY